MVMGTRKRRAVTYGKCESVDSDEVVRLKEELKEAKRLLDEAHACMMYKEKDNSLLCMSQIPSMLSQSQVDGDGGSVTAMGGAEDNGMNFVSSQVSVGVPASQSFLQVEPCEQLGSLSQLSELNADDAVNLLHVVDWGNSYEKHRFNHQEVLYSPESEKASSDDDPHQLNVSHSTPPHESISANELHIEKPGLVTVLLPDVVRTGLAVILLSPDHPGCILTGTRKGSHGAGMLALPGGHLEVGEAWDTSATREVMEETGLCIPSPFFACVTNDVGLEGGRHYVTIFMQSTVPKGYEPRLCEPDKCLGWRWEPWVELKRLAKGCDPTNKECLFPPLQNMLKASSYDPFSAAVQL